METKMKKKKTSNTNGIDAGGVHAVGYGMPPKHSQFQKGKSGNPKGRPKGSVNLDSVVLETFNQKVTITVNGKVKKVPAIQALSTRVLSLAMGGNQACIKLVFGLYSACQPANDNQTLTMGSSFELSPEELASIDKWTLLKGIK